MKIKGTNEKNVNEKSMQMKKSIRMERWKVYEWKVYKLKIIWNEKEASKCLFNKTKCKCTQPNKKVVPSDSKCTWSNVNLEYGNMTI